MSRKRLKPYLEILDELNVELIDVSHTGSCHYKLHVAAGERKRFFIVPYSTSDRRSILNWKSNVRQWLADRDDPRR